MTSGKSASGRSRPSAISWRRSTTTRALLRPCALKTLEATPGRVKNPRKRWARSAALGHPHREHRLPSLLAVQGLQASTGTATTRTFAGKAGAPTCWTTGARWWDRSSQKGGSQTPWVCAARCKGQGHGTCSRMRTWKTESEPLDRVEQVLAKWLLDGAARKTAEAHKQLPRD